MYEVGKISVNRKERIMIAVMIEIILIVDAEGLAKNIFREHGKWERITR